MLLSHCPNCQHDNPPGERFCAACGVPLDLKPCPVCGKVDNVKATVCSGCGAHFPVLAGGVHASGPGVSAAPAAKPIPPVVAPPPTTIRALPLIIVALAAGGIPLLWLYRNTMPVPKAWQTPTPAIEAAAPTPQAPQVVPPPPPAPAALIPLPPKAAPQPAVEMAPAVETRVKPPEAPKPAKSASRPAAKASPAPAAKEPAAPAASECTEALAAVGLCDPKAGK
jgi:hypothetical protein